ncbi:teicoplanin resistance protein VanZ [Lysinibacillus sp. 2017]|uniref:VanZ family protein n=1 Tax=unclassified Lysinibacillus TaxID=2636778 RepID=UPI000D529B65|nr:MULTISPECIES: VanZ family protein [unclassified Lysinibacillus]AWE06952.1 teicoplanin resistance protein VanZ [Lysinibacillus sp. 2017]TGN37122.1 VanZ family protein [Lysinibacillus sp. S2017]
MKKLKKLLLNILLYAVLVFYLVVLFGLLFLKARDFSSVNLVPFYSIGSFLFSDDPLLHAFSFSNVIGNIVLFVPLGLYLSLFIREKNVVKNVLLVIFISVSVEVLQFVFKVGATDIDDVILNGFGGFIGIIAYHILLKMIGDAQKVKLIVTLGAPIAAIFSVLGIIIYNG